MLLVAAKNTDHREPWDVSVRGCFKDCIIGFGFGVIWRRVQGNEGCHLFSIIGVWYFCVVR